jgi:peptide/nickel transport system substrate-binding protein
MVLAPVIMIVVIIIVGAGGYAALNAVSGSGSTTVTSCAPASSAACKAAAGGNDVSTFVAFAPAFGTSVLQVTQGQSVPITVSVPEASSGFQVLWGDGSNTSQTTATFTHSYSGLGSYVISAEANIKGVWHTGTGWLYPVNVGPSLQSQSSGEYPAVAATLANGATTNPWATGQGTFTVTGTYTAAPANPAFVPQTTSFTATGGTQTASSPTTSGGSATYSFASAGVYQITMVGPISTGGTGGLPATIYQNYTWTVYVAPTGLTAGCGQCRTSGSVQAKSPHPGTITDYEVAPAGATTTDPAIAYDTVSAEIVYNVYQTLVTYNGSSTATFIPQLATCVPGSAQCTALYGNDLEADNASVSTSSATYWTFVIDPHAQFYDPSTGAHWGVYPTDVEYSIARTLSFADLPGIEATAGWILAQSLLPAGQLNWDSSPLTGFGIHQPFNNTPQNIFASMLINDTAYCPSAALTSDHGCITFVADGPGAQNGLTLPPRTWSNFLQFVADPLGGAVTPAGWDMAQGAGAALPGWPAVSGAGDQPITLPGGYTSTNQTISGVTFWQYIASAPALAPKAWDSTQELAFNIPDVNKELRYNLVGSGPYYQVGEWNPSVGYVLKANPNYAQPVGCAGLTWCEPAPGAYAQNVKVFWGSSDTAGIQQYIAGDTDFAAILQPETPTLLSLVQQGKIGAFTTPTLNIFFFNYAETFDVQAAQAIDPFTLNVPGTFFASDAVRNFVNYAYPYTTVENTINTIDGIQFGYNYGGAIPGGMGNYYPENISWANSDPANTPTVAGTAAWWWAQMIDPTSPLYDSYVANTCTTASPCEFPIIGELGAPSLDATIQLWIHEIEALSGGRLEPNTFDLSFTQLVVGTLSSPPSTLPFPLYTLAWAPDYPDPTDYVPTLWTNGSYGLPDAAFYTFSQAAYNSGSCGNLDNLAYWANQPYIPQDCQGVAFMTMDYWMGIAGTAPTGANRVLLYNMIEHIGNALALQQYTFQENGVGTYAPWVNEATIDINPMWAGDALFYFIQGNGVVS